MPKVLLVDDEVEILEIVANIISSYFQEVDIVKCKNGLDAFIECQKNKFELIITDHKMPFMTGAALVVGIRTRENFNKKTHIIMLSAHMTNDLKDELNLQKLEFMEKPLDYENFINLITPYLV